MAEDPNTATIHTAGKNFSIEAEEYGSRAALFNDRQLAEFDREGALDVGPAAGAKSMKKVLPFKDNRMLIEEQVEGVTEAPGEQKRPSAPNVLLRAAGQGTDVPTKVVRKPLDLRALFGGRLSLGSAEQPESDDGGIEEIIDEYDCDSVRSRDSAKHVQNIMQKKMALNLRTTVKRIELEQRTDAFAVLDIQKSLQTQLDAKLRTKMQRQTVKALMRKGERKQLTCQERLQAARTSMGIFVNH